MAKKIMVYIGRFQPFHRGHEYVLNRALSTSDHVIVLIGSAFQARTIKNPFTFAERSEMIKNWFTQSGHAGQSGLSIHPLTDSPYNDALWIQQVQEIVSGVEESIGPAEVHITGSNRDESTWYLLSFPQYKQDLLPATRDGAKLNATELRVRLFDGPFDATEWADVPAATLEFLASKFIHTPEFKTLVDEFNFIQMYRSGWSKAPYAPTFVTVDAVVVQSGHVLVIKRGALPGKGLWALPGGFLDQKETLESAAIRELIEETDIKVPEPVLRGSIKAREVFDHPDRSLRGRTITTAFLIKLDDTKPLPKVKGQNAPLHETGGEIIQETARAFWLPISTALSHREMWFEDHLDIISTLIGKLKD